MPHFEPRVVPLMERTTSYTAEKDAQLPTTNPPSRSPERIRVKNRRKRYLDTHPDYFGASLELADPLLYDRLVRRFQSAAEREAEGRAKGYSGVLEADLMRSEAKLDALTNPDPNAMFSYKRGADGQIVAEEKDEVPPTREEGLQRWRYEMEMRFLRGDDIDFDYPSVDESEKYDDLTEEERERQDDYFKEEQPTWVLENGQEPQGETGIQDF
jgi:hypothetical protein